MKYFVDYMRGDGLVKTLTPYEKDRLFSRQAVVTLETRSIDLSKGWIFKDGKLVELSEDSATLTLYKKKNQVFGAKMAAQFDRVLKDVIMSGGSYADVKTEMERRDIELCRLENELNELEDKHALLEQKLIAQEVKARMKKGGHLYHNVICAIAKDETPYLKEWIEYHLDLGIEHIYLYDDDSRIPIVDTVAGLNEEYKSKVTVKVLPPTNQSRQRFAYSEFLRDYEAKVKWVSFLDIDEFINLKGVPVKKFLSRFEKGDKIGEVKMRWLTYGENGQEAKTDLPVRERFTKVSPWTEQVKDLGKVFVRCAAIESVDYHANELGQGLIRVDCNGLELPHDKWEEYPYDEAAYVEHYYTKSLEEWREKISRGSADPCWFREHEEFYMHNPDMQP